MRRRSLLRGLSAGLIATSIAGCSGESNSDATAYPGLEIRELQSESTRSGTVVVDVGIQNSGTAAGSAQLICRVEFEEGSTYTDERSITVEPGQTAQVRFEFDVNQADLTSGATYTYDVRIE